MYVSMLRIERKGGTNRPFSSHRLSIVIELMRIGKLSSVCFSVQLGEGSESEPQFILHSNHRVRGFYIGHVAKMTPVVVVLIKKAKPRLGYIPDVPQIRFASVNGGAQFSTVAPGCGQSNRFVSAPVHIRSSRTAVSRIVKSKPN